MNSCLTVSEFKCFLKLKPIITYDILCISLTFFQTKWTPDAGGWSLSPTTFARSCRQCGGASSTEAATPPKRRKSLLRRSRPSPTGLISRTFSAETWASRKLGRTIRATWSRPKKWKGNFFKLLSAMNKNYWVLIALDFVDNQKINLKCIQKQDCHNSGFIRLVWS